MHACIIYHRTARWGSRSSVCWSQVTFLLYHQRQRYLSRTAKHLCSVTLWVAFAVRTIIVILTMEGEIVAHQEFSVAVTGIHAWQACTWKVPVLWVTVLSLLSTAYLVLSAPATHTSAHVHANTLRLFTHHTIVCWQTVSLGHLCSLPTRGRWHVFDGQNHCTVYFLCLLSAKHTTTWEWGVGGWASGMFVLLSAFRRDLM